MNNSSSEIFTTVQTPFDSPRIPEVSIAIPTLNSGKTLNQCLDSIVNLDYPLSKIEVLIIDGGSTDNTVDIAKRYKTRIIFESKRTRGAAYNRGLAESKGRYISFIDSDAYVVPSWLKKMVKQLSMDTCTPAVHCRVKAPNNSTFFQKCVDSVNCRGKGQANGVIYRSELLSALGGFRERIHYNQEDELRYRLEERGFKTKYLDEILVYHYPRRTLGGYFKQNIQAGLGTLALYRHTKQKSMIVEMILRAIMLFFPLLLLMLVEPRYSLPALFIVALLYIFSIARRTNRDYFKIKYLIFVPFVTYISLIGNFVGYTKGVLTGKPVSEYAIGNDRP